MLQIGKKDVAISKIEPVGSYAVQLCFSDGHDTGIFSWDLLYDHGVRQHDMWQHICAGSLQAVRAGIKNN